MNFCKPLHGAKVLVAAAALCIAACNEASSPAPAILGAPAANEAETMGSAKSSTPEQIQAATAAFLRDSVVPTMEREEAARAVLSKSADISGYRYFVLIHTANVDNAGTGAAMFISIYGTSGWIEDLPMAKPNINDFEKNSLETYDREYNPTTIWQGWGDMGTAAWIQIRHDNRGSKPGWLGDYAVVYKCAYLAEYCDSYLFELNAGGQDWIAEGYSNYFLWQYDNWRKHYYRNYNRTGAPQTWPRSFLPT